MEAILKLYAFFTGPEAYLYFAVLFAISEAIGMIPQIKASGVFQAIYNGLLWLKANVFKPKA